MNRSAGWFSKRVFEQKNFPSLDTVFFTDSVFEIDFLGHRITCSILDITLSNHKSSDASDEFPHSIIADRLTCVGPPLNPIFDHLSTKSARSQCLIDPSGKSKGTVPVMLLPNQ